jgi:hypothetical protein
MKKPSASATLSPLALAMVNFAPSASITAGMSLDGSPCDMFPPMVPRFLTSGSAMLEAASNMIGYFPLIDALFSMSSIVVSAPIWSSL